MAMADNRLGKPGKPNKPSPGAAWTGQPPPPLPDPTHTGTHASWTGAPDDAHALGPNTALARPTRLLPLPLVYLIGLVGGVGGVLAAFLRELAMISPLTIYLVAPAVEEICKPLIVVFLIELRPHWLRRGRHVIAICLLSALVFATIENMLYLHVSHPTNVAFFMFWRYVICTAMHLIASLVMALGLAKALRGRLDNGERFDFDRIMKYYVAAVVIHAAYNTTVTVLGLSGVLRF